MATDDPAGDALDAASKEIKAAAESLKTIDDAALPGPAKARIERLRQKADDLAQNVSMAVRRPKAIAGDPTRATPVDEPARSLAQAAEKLRSIDREALASKDRATLDTLESRAQRLSRDVSYAVRRRTDVAPTRGPAAKKKATPKKPT